MVKKPSVPRQQVESAEKKQTINSEKYESHWINLLPFSFAHSNRHHQIKEKYQRKNNYNKKVN